MLNEKIYFIAAVGTDIGKTFLVENLCRILQGASAIKPIASGFSDDDLGSDSARILTAMGLKTSQENLNAISPWRFVEAASPHFAAQNLNCEIDFVAVENFCRDKISQACATHKFFFVEAAGGVMTPINYNKTFLDLAEKLRIPVLLVTANYLGAISHTLCAVEALRSRKIVLEKIIVNDELPINEKKSQDIVQTLENMTSIPTLSLQNFLKNLLD